MSKIIEGLIDIKAVSLNFETPYIWASGIHAPIYCDNRKTLGHFTLRASISKALTDLIKVNYPNVQIIGGTATAGIPHATSVADRLQLPLVYFRSKAKDHGTKGKIEGDFKKGQSVVIIEDLISTGGSVIDSVNTAREAGLEVLGVVSIFNYQLDFAVNNFKTENISWHSLLGFEDLIKQLNLGAGEVAFIESWRKNPYDTSIWKSKVNDKIK